MKKIDIYGLEKILYKETLDNGLDIYMLPYEDKTGYSMHYVTKFGSVNTEFVPIGKEKEIKVPDGIAHFLEHKMFESEDGVDPFTFASQYGADSNASTYYKYTRYLFEGSNGFYENLDYLLKFVNTPYFTDSNVEKEKGIITEELLQYKDMIDFVMDNAIKENVFSKDNMRIDIGGTVDSIKKITKEELYDTYNTFYQPSNMFLVLTGNFDVDKALDIIKNNKELNSKESNKSIVEKKIDEPFEVNNKFSRIKFNTQTTKVSYSIKVPLKGINNKYEYVTYFGMMLSSLFGLSSDFREDARKNELMTSFYYSREYSNDYMIISFLAVSEKPDLLIEKIKDTINEMNITEEDVQRIKRVWISSEIMMIDDYNVSLDNIVYDVIEFGDIIDNKLDIYKGMNVETLLKYMDGVDFSNSTTVIIEPKSRN